MRDVVLRFVGAGALVAALPWIAAHFSDRLAGVVLLFPVVTLSGFFVLGAQGGTASIAEASVASVAALPVVLTFLVAVHLAARQDLSVTAVLGIGVVAWVAAVAVLIFITARKGKLR